MRKRLSASLLLAFAITGLCIIAVVSSSQSRESTKTPVENGHESYQLVAPDGARDDRLGESVALSGRFALVGAPLAHNPLPASGAAYLYAKTSDKEWNYLGKLFPNASAAGDVFGFSVALYGSTVLIGAPGNGYSRKDISGAAYIFEIGEDGTRKQVAKLMASDAAADDNFGSSVALSNNLAVVGAPQRYESGSGAAYVFRLDQKGNWNEVATLTPDDAGSENGFGKSVAVDGQTVVVGGMRDRGGAIAVGAAYVFRCDRLEHWKQVTKLTAGGVSAGFGASLALHGDTLIVGACFDSSTKVFAGAAYVFRRDGRGSWGLVTKLTAADATANDLFGRSVALSGNTAVVGAIRHNTAGAVYVFKSDDAENWKQTCAYAADDAPANNLLGSSVAISGDAVLAGAPHYDATASNSGSAYVFRIGVPQ